MSEEVKRLRRILFLFETLLEKERNALAELHRDQREASRKQKDAVELLNSEDAFALGISTLLISSSMASARKEAAIKSQFAGAARRVLRRNNQIDSLKRKIRKAEVREDQIRQARGE